MKIVPNGHCACNICKCLAVFFKMSPAVFLRQTKSQFYLVFIMECINICFMNQKMLHLATTNITYIYISNTFSKYSSK